MDQVKIRAVVAAGGLRKHQEVTVAATPLVEGAISNGVFLELERYPSGSFDDEPVRDIEEVELPESGEMDTPPLDEPKPKAPRQRG